VATVIEWPSENRLDDGAICHGVAIAKLNLFVYSNDSHVCFDAAHKRSRCSRRVRHLEVHVVSLQKTISTHTCRHSAGLPVYTVQTCTRTNSGTFPHNKQQLFTTVLKSIKDACIITVSSVRYHDTSKQKYQNQYHWYTWRESLSLTLKHKMPLYCTFAAGHVSAYKMNM